VNRFAYGAIALFLIPFSPLHAQNPAIDELKGKIFDARMAQQTFVNGFRFCNELDGTNFYYQPRNRVLKLEEYHRSLENLARAQVYNSETRRPWSSQEANDRWEEVKKQAQADKEKCELVQSLPELEKRLQELQKNTAASEKKE